MIQLATSGEQHNPTHCISTENIVLLGDHMHFATLPLQRLGTLKKRFQKKLMQNIRSR